MTERERVIRALQFKHPDRVPRHLTLLPAVRLFRKKELDAFLQKIPLDFYVVAHREEAYGPSKRAKGSCEKVGCYTDPWGCVWETMQAGIIGEIKSPILTDELSVDSYTPPWEMLKGMNFDRVATIYQNTDKFVLATTETRPFERMQFLMGTENIFVGLATNDSSVLKLLNKLHEFFVREMELWSNARVDGVSFMDDWGTQRSLIISPELWRKLFKPLYTEYVRILHSKGKYAFFHTDGNVESIFEDFIEIGIDAINSQLFCMDIEALASKYKGRITFWGEIDRQWVLPFGSQADVRQAVMRVRRALDDGSGGVIAQCEWGIKDPAENIFTVFQTWEEPLK